MRELFRLVRMVARREVLRRAFCFSVYGMPVEYWLLKEERYVL